MGFKSGLLIGFGAGYVLGARAGRERYEDIRRAWAQLTGSPTVQRAAWKTKEVAEQGAKQGLEVVQKGVEKAGGAVKGRLGKTGTDDGVVTLVDETNTATGTAGRTSPTVPDPGSSGNP